VCDCVYRTVSRSEGEALAARLDCAYFETSAAEDLSSVTTAFGRVLGDVLRLRDRQPTLQVHCTGAPLVRSIDVKTFFIHGKFLTFLTFLWPPCVADADFIFLPVVSFYLSIFFPRLISAAAD